MNGAGNQPSARGKLREPMVYHRELEPVEWFTCLYISRCLVCQEIFQRVGKFMLIGVD
jgi:hypothetical protein